MRSSGACQSALPDPLAYNKQPLWRTDMHQSLGCQPCRYVSARESVTVIAKSHQYPAILVTGTCGSSEPSVLRWHTQCSIVSLASRSLQRCVGASASGIRAEVGSSVRYCVPTSMRPTELRLPHPQTRQHIQMPDPPKPRPSSHLLRCVPPPMSTTCKSPRRLFP